MSLVALQETNPSSAWLQVIIIIIIIIIIGWQPRLSRQHDASMLFFETVYH